MGADVTTEVSRLTATVERLTDALERVQQRQRRARAMVGVGLVAAAAFFLGGHLLNPAQAQATQPGAPSDPSAMAAARDDLFRSLSPEQRREVEQLEQDVAWVSRYLHLYRDQFDPGAMIAVMLGRMAKSVEAVPEMRQEMQIMNAKMNALPVMATEMQGMDAKMGVMAAGMDSTMGRAGRMMPWNW